MSTARKASRKGVRAVHAKCTALEQREKYETLAKADGRNCPLEKTLSFLIGSHFFRTPALAASASAIALFEDEVTLLSATESDHRRFSHSRLLAAAIASNLHKCDCSSIWACLCKKTRSNKRCVALRSGSVAAQNEEVTSSAVERRRNCRNVINGGLVILWRSLCLSRSLHVHTHMPSHWE